MKRLVIHKSLITLLLVIFAIIVLHTLQSIHKGSQVKGTNESVTARGLFAN
ncbi:MAG: hypothetical protein KF746_09350 [Chitinophagaceae bacterium]|nr:hypothetical protein [Chitinophagaceae bacterium]